MITMRKAVRAVRAALPAWAVAAFAVCLFIPGPFDEIAALAFAGMMCAAQPVRIARARSAWRGGKTERHYCARTGFPA